MGDSTTAFPGLPDQAQPHAPAAFAGRPHARQALRLLDYRWVQRAPATVRTRLCQQGRVPPAHSVLERPEPPPDLHNLYTHHVDLDCSGVDAGPPEPTLDDSVIEALIHALYDALPDTLTQTAAATTPSGNRLGRHGYAPRAVPAAPWPPVTEPPGAATQTAETLSPPPAQAQPAPEPAPRPYVLGAAPDGLPQVTLRSLADLALQLPPDPAAGVVRGRAELGRGEPCFLRAQSAFWSWRTHRQANMDLHAHGPPVPGRNALIEQKIGPVTLLLGCRVVDLVEEPRRWGFTLGSLEGQVLVCRETFLVEWLPDDRVVFSLSTQQHLAMPNLTFLAPVHSALRRKFRQESLRNMQDMTAD